MANYNQFTDRAARIPRVLFFTASMVPTEDEYAAAAKFAPNVGIRNGQLVADMPMSPLEECDAVAGPAIPARYAKTYPDVSSFDPSESALRMSDLDRFSGKVTDTDNEAKRAAKPPAVGQSVEMSQGAPRPAGAITQAGGGFIAPRPANPDNLPQFGSERAENAPAGTVAGALPAYANPHNLPDAGATVLRPGQPEDTTSAAGPVVEAPAGTSGFTAPKPEPESKGKAKGGKKTGDENGPTA